MFLFHDLQTKPPPRPKRNKNIDVDSPIAASEWLENFLSSRPWLCCVDENYLKDNFNLYGLSALFEDYQPCIKHIRGEYADFNSSKTLTEIESLCSNIYCLIHARYLLTFPGIREMKKKFDEGVYGACPRLACANQKMLPIGLSPAIGENQVKVFCPCCQDVYDCECELDGAFFGPYFPHFFTTSLKDDLHCNQLTPTIFTVAGIPIAPHSLFNRSLLVHSH